MVIFHSYVKLPRGYHLFMSFPLSLGWLAEHHHRNCSGQRHGGLEAANTKQHKTQLPSWWRKPRTAAPRRTPAQAEGEVVQLVAVQVVIPPDRLTDSTPGHVVQLVTVQVAVQVAIPPVSLTVNQSCIGWQGWRRRHVWVYASSVLSLYGHGNSGSMSNSSATSQCLLACTTIWLEARCSC